MKIRNKFRIGLAICVLLIGAYFAKPIVAGIGDVKAYFNESGTEVFSISQAGVCTVTSFVAPTVDINAGTIDGTTVGASSASTGAFTTLTASGLTTITNATDASNLTTASAVLSGGLAVTKQLFIGDDIDMSVSGTGVYDITLKDAVADALSIVRGSTDMMVFNTSTPLITITPATTISGLLTAAGGIDTVGATTDITLKNDATIVNTSADLLTITETTVDVVGILTANSMASDGAVSGTTITASTGFVLGDGDYIGVTDNEVIKFNTAGTIKVEGADLYVGGTAADEVRPSLLVVGDADSDAVAVSEALTIALTANATPTLATWGFTSTQSAGYTFDKDISVNSDKVVVSEETNLQAIMHGSATVATTDYDGTATITYGKTFTATPTIVVTVAETLNAGYDSIVNVEDIGMDTCIVRLIDCVDDDSSIVVNYIVMGDE